MGRLFSVAVVAMIGFGGPIQAKPDQSAQAKNRPERAEAARDISCPPGLRTKNLSCMPPGQFKKMFELGQRVPAGYRGLVRYDDLPYDVRMSYGGALDPDSRYVYDQQYLYRIDPTTMVVRQILRLLI